MPSDVPRAWWIHLDGVPDEPHQPDVLRLVADEFERGLAALAARPTPLTGTVNVTNARPVLEVTVRGVRTVEISLAAIRRAGDERMPMTTLIACALARREALGDDWLPQRVGTGTAPADELINRYPLVPGITSVTRQLDRNLESGVDSVVCGGQGSGASELVATWATARARSGERGLVWLNPSDPADGPESIYDTLLKSEQRDGYLVVVDGVQSNPHNLLPVRACLNDLRDTYGLKIVLVATSWPSLVARLPDPFKGLRPVTADGAEVVGLVFDETPLTPQQRAELQQLVGSNVHLAAAALELFAADGRVPDRAGLRTAVTGATTDPATQKALYWLACLSVFEIDVPQRLAERECSRQAIDDLVCRRLLWLTDGAYTIGSGARAGLILEEAIASWDAAARWREPAKIVKDYLSNAGEATIIATLERADLVGLIDDPNASAGTKYLAIAWEQRARLVRMLAAHYRAYGTWNDCIGADVFSGHVFAETKNAEAWRAVAGRVRRRFTYGDATTLPTIIGHRTSDYADFHQILASIEQADRDEGDRPRPARWERAPDLDSGRFYLTWVLGLLLGFEGTALDHDQNRVDQLLAVAEAQQDPGQGWFYPMRAPWNTARMVIGLCQAGQTYDSSPVVRLACDWLRTPATVGGPLHIWWRSGTGQWNTDEATTAMCLIALHLAGVGPSRATRTATDWLLGQRGQWGQPNREIDLALVVETMLRYHTVGTDLHDGVLTLLQWALDVPDGGLPPVGSEVPEDNLRLPFVAAQLTVVIWATMMRELSAGVIDHGLRPYLVTATDSQTTSADGCSTDLSSSPRTTYSTAADATANGLDNLDLNKWIHAVEILRDSLWESIKKRQRASSTTEVAAAITALRADLEHIHKLGANLSPHTSVIVLGEIDKMGRRVCADRWPHLPRPRQNPHLS